MPLTHTRPVRPGPAHRTMLALLLGVALLFAAPPAAGAGPTVPGAARAGAGRRALPGARTAGGAPVSGDWSTRTGPGSRCVPRGRARSCSQDLWPAWSGSPSTTAATCAPATGRCAGCSFAAARSVAAGTVIASAAGALHFGVRIGGRYVDPAALARPARAPRPTAPEPDRQGSTAAGGALWARRRVGTCLARGAGSVSVRCPESLASSVARVPSGLDHNALGPSLRSPARIRPAGAGPSAGNRSEGGPPHGRRHDATAARSRCALRAPDPPVEPEDAALHLRRAFRHLHHRSAADAAQHRYRVQLRAGPVRRRWDPPLHRDQEAGPGSDPGAGRAVRHAVRQPALAGRDADELRDHRQARRPRCRSTSACGTPASSRRCRRRRR